jgi:uncharacterized protein (TIGR00299 family) protein
MAHPLLYVDPWSGISGDMLLAALLDTDRDGDRLEGELRRAVSALGLDEGRVRVSREVEWGVACTRVAVDHGGEQLLRHLSDMQDIIAGSRLPEKVRIAAAAAVQRLAEVEASIHDCPVEQIHFHEVGAVDTLVDVVGAFVLVDTLGVESVFVGPIPVGGGTVEIAHGRMGVPAPATARLLEGYAVVAGPEPRELTTPTGALLISQLGAQAGGMPAMTLERIGYGAGTLKLEGGPNLLRVVAGRPLQQRRVQGSSAADTDVLGGVPGGEGRDGDTAVELQTNLDDVSGEVIGHTMRLLRSAGALDVWAVPAQMKKDRPGVVLHALVEPGAEDRLVAMLFEQTGTLGVRRCPMFRHVAERGVVQVAVSGEPVAVKWGRWEARLVSVAPEYESCAAAAAKTGLALKDVMQRATEAARRELGAGLE